MQIIDSNFYLRIQLQVLLIPCLLFSCLMHSGTVFAQKLTYTYEDLVERIYDMKFLANVPEPGEVSGAATSYDRGSQYNAIAQQYENWSFNGDGTGVVRRDGDADVLLDLQGPGVIWRIWSARPQQGHLQIFIDGADSPVIDQPFLSIFESHKGPFAYTTLNRVMARGYNLFVPISFQKSCKIVGQPNWGKYFHFTYTQFPEKTQIPSFTGDFSPEQRRALAKAQDILARRGQLGDDVGVDFAVDTLVHSKTITVEPGKSVTVFNLEGPRAITQLQVDTDLLDKKDQARVFRELSIEMFWDGAEEPAVWAPLGDFFGCGYGASAYESWPLGLNDAGFYSRWYMPFATDGLIKIHNDGQEPQTLTLKIKCEKLQTNPEDLLRFHAKWHRNFYGTQNPKQYFEDRWPDWPVLLLDGGQGRFCGMSLHVWNPFNHLNKKHKQMYVSQLPRAKGPIPPHIEKAIMTRWWWGEGDEKFFVDHEKFPSTYGTGTEDYIGYAWCNPTVFDSHTQNQPRNHQNVGHITVSRFHMADNIPFQQAFEASIEKYHDDNWPLLYAATAYWYQSVSVVDPYVPQPIEQRVDYFEKPQIESAWLDADGKQYGLARDIMGMVLYEGEDLLELAEHSDDLTLIKQSMNRFGSMNWSQQSQLFARSNQPDHAVTLQMPVADSGRKTLFFFPTSAPDYSIVSIKVNGEMAIDGLDTYSDRVQGMGSIKLGTFEPVGDQFLIEIITQGANGHNKTGRYYWGIDAFGVKDAG